MVELSNDEIAETISNIARTVENPQSTESPERSRKLQTEFSLTYHQLFWRIYLRKYAPNFVKRGRLARTPQEKMEGLGDVIDDHEGIIYQQAHKKEEQSNNSPSTRGQAGSIRIYHGSRT